MRTIAFAFAVVLGLSLPTAASSSLVTHTQTFSFIPGGSLRIRVSDGRMKIMNGSDSKHIVLRYSAKDDDDGTDASGCVKRRFEVNGSQVEIDLTGRTNGSCNLDVEVEVPSPINLRVRMTAGDLAVEGVEGNLDITDRVGDLTIRAGPEKEYRLIEASTHVGDLNGLSGRIHGWIGKSGSITGAGPYRLYARVWVGDVHLAFD